ncbi:MAG TPA: MarR family winged helix-turn-helix transcriptional regulator [Spirochaetota bacterium]|nr:MarR family winged helix-turn-helix transcriptional regulator [Spirochaetota bacterium]
MEQIDNNIITGIEKICQISRILLWDLAKEENLSPIQIQFLDYLNNKPKELRTLTNLSLEFDLKKPTVSDSINNLIKKDFLVRHQDQDDKRIYYLDLTSKAHEKIEKINRWNLTIYEKIKSVPQNDKSVISKFFVNLIKELYEEKVFKVAKMCYYCANFQKNKDNNNQLPYYCSFTNRYFSDGSVNFNCNEFKT